MILSDLIKEKERLEELINKKDGETLVYSGDMIAKWQAELVDINNQILPLLTEMLNSMTKLQ